MEVLAYQSIALIALIFVLGGLIADAGEPK